MWVVGLGDQENSADWRDVDFAFRGASGNLFIYESGNYQGAFGNLNVGDELSINVRNGMIEYYRNGTLLHMTSTAVVDYYLDSSFKSGVIALDDFGVTQH